MLKASHGPAKPDIKRVVNDLLVEDSNFDRAENRSAHREHPVRSVTIELRNTGESIPAFSRNISATGIGLITANPLKIDQTGILTLERLHGRDLQFLAECRWCKAYGENWYISGWQFIKINR